LLYLIVNYINRHKLHFTFHLQVLVHLENYPSSMGRGSGRVVCGGIGGGGSSTSGSVDVVGVGEVDVGLDVDMVVAGTDDDEAGVDEEATAEVRCGIGLAAIGDGLGATAVFEIISLFRFSQNSSFILGSVNHTDRASYHK